jgi:GT2 family glycosyltransferase
MGQPERMSRTSPTTGLLVPCFNALRFLPRLRAQVERLNPAFDEVILADDASTDTTASVAESLGFRVIKLPANLGPGGARNALARASTADWIHFHDVDDELAHDYLAQIKPTAITNNDIIFHFTDFIDEKTRELIIRWKFEPEALAIDPALTLLLEPLPTASSFIRRSCFLASGGFDEQLRCFEDGDLHFRLAAGGARVASVPAVLEWSLRHDQGISTNQLYCYKCRLQFLESYATSQPARLHPAIANAAERAAVQLLRLGDQSSARRAIALAERLGRRVPTSNHRMLRLLRTIIPATTLLKWQDRWRQN